MSLHKVDLRCEACKREFSEYIDLPMPTVPFIARLKGWNRCPGCGSSKVFIVSGATAVPDQAAGAQ